jgi:hypothetical protein
MDKLVRAPWPAQPRTPDADAAHGSGAEPRVRSHCRFRKRCTEYVSDSGIKWVNGSTERQCDRALAEPSRGPEAVEPCVVGPARHHRVPRCGR